MPSPNGGGPPEGSFADSPYAQQIPLDLIQKQLGGLAIERNDPAFQPPVDPLNAGTAALSKAVYRDIPLVVVQNNWTVDEVRAALATHMAGIFERSAQMVDSMLGDDRVCATLGSRISGLFGHEVRFKPANNSDAAKECLRAWEAHWPLFASAASFVPMHTYGIFMGFSPGQLVWDATGPIACPYLRPWHPRYTYYHWSLRRYVALSLDGQIAINPGDGKWVLHAPYGEYRGWIRGAVRPVAEPWLIRHFAIRDWARFSEVHGMPIRKAIVPAASAEPERDRFQQQVSHLGNTTTIMLPQGVDGAHGGNAYDLALLEATDQAWQSFPGLRDHCDMAIVLAILFQNLTTEVKGGSFAATSAHMDIRQSGVQGDNVGWRSTIYSQIARPFAYINFGDADLAPWSDWDVQPLADYDAMASLLQKFGTAVEVLRRGGVEFADEGALRRFARSMGLKLPAMKLVEPVASGGLGK